MTAIRNRNKGKRRVFARDLKPHPKNWRLHSARQKGAMRSLLEEIGFVGTLLAVERDKGLQLIDGHLRADLAADVKVDVMVVDLTDEEVELLLATHDMVGEMADADADKLEGLLAELNVASGELADMFSEAMSDLELLEELEDDADGTPAAEKEECKYPLVPVMHEKYDYAIIFAKNEEEWEAVQLLLGMEKEKSYKTTGVAVGRVAPATKFVELWSNRYEDTDSLPGEPSGEGDNDA